MCLKTFTERKQYDFDNKVRGFKCITNAFGIIKKKKHKAESMSNFYTLGRLKETHYYLMTRSHTFCDLK